MTSYWHGREVLVTGAGGFIGSTLTEELVRQGAKVRAFVRYNSRGEPGFLKMMPAELRGSVELIAGDIRDLPAYEEAAEGVDTIFHLGALIAIPYSYKHPVEVAEVNVMGTLNALMAAKRAGVRRLIHTSTSEVYGTALRVPIDEEHPLQGQSPYSASKIGADKLAESFYCTYELPVVTVRPFNTYGPRQSTRAVIPTIITQALTLDTIQLGSLETRRDFTFVTDTVSGFMRAAETEGVEGQTFNLGVGEEVTVGELVEIILRHVNRNVTIVQDPQRMRPQKSEVMRLLSNNSKARARLGWKPEVSMEEGLKRTITWINEHLDLYQPGKYQF